MKRSKKGCRYISAILSAVLVVSLIVPTTARNYFSAYSGESDFYYSDTDFEQGDYGLDDELGQDLLEGDISTPDAVCEHGDTCWTDNGDGTHDQVCDDCSKHLVTSEAHLDSDSDSVCDRCGSITGQASDEVCEHKNTRWISNDDSTHGRVCDDCGERIIMSEPHFDYNSDGSCDQCGYVSIQTPDEVCDHGHAHWVDNGDGTHDQICYNCGEHIVVNEAHFDSNDDGVCDKCRSVSGPEPTPECEHIHAGWDDNGNDTHNQICYDCDEYLVENEAHLDNNLDGVCDRCNSIISQASDEECDHPYPRWVDNGDGTHDRICYDCNEHIVAGEAHLDGDGDGACNRCGYISNLLVAELCEHTNTIWVDNGDETHDQVCEDCNEHLVMGGVHYDGDGDGFCDECKAVTTQLLIATIPLTLPITANLNGEVAVADNAEIRNLSSTQAIKVTDVRVSVFSGWTLVDGDTVFAEADRGAQQLAMGFRGTPVRADGSMDMAQADWIIETNGRLPLNMEASIPAQDQGASQFTIGRVSFALDWVKNGIDPEPPVEEVVTAIDHDRMAKAFGGTGVDANNIAQEVTAKIIRVAKGNPQDGIDISEAQDRTVLATMDDDVTGVICLNNAYLTSTNSMFRGFRSLTSVDLSELDTSRVEDMSFMFSDCQSLSSLDLSGFDTSKVTTMREMFNTCLNLTSLNVSGWDTRKVTDMRAMFLSCRNLAPLDVSNFDTSNVTDMGSMFCFCTALTSLDVANFDTSSVTDMSAMFSYCFGLKTLNISSFDISNVTKMGSMFHMSEELTTLYVRDETAKTKISGAFGHPNPDTCTIIVGAPPTEYVNDFFSAFF